MSWPWLGHQSTDQFYLQSSLPKPNIPESPTASAASDGRSQNSPPAVRNKCRHQPVPQTGGISRKISTVDAKGKNDGEPVEWHAFNQ